MTDRSILWLNTHRDTCNPLQTWDTMHLQRAIGDAVDWCWYHEPLPLAPPPGVVMISGQHHDSPEDYAHIRGVLDSLDEPPVVIIHSDEASLFKWWLVDRPGIRWWISTPRHDVHHPLIGQARFFGEGPGPIPERGWPTAAKRIDVQFAGQSTHVRRKECVQALRDLKRSRSDLRVEVHETAGFMQGVSRADYLTDLAMSRFVACPSGAQTVDSFRLYEAIECGAVPIAERRTPDGEDHQFWSLAFPDDPPPFPIVDSWKELPDVLGLWGDPQDWPAHVEAAQAWWDRQQANLRTWLRADLGLRP